MVVNIKQIVMNKIKSVLAIALLFAISVPCFGNTVTIKRKKNKWNNSLEQTALDNTDNNAETTKVLNY